MPLGYDPDGRTLKINEAEAKTIRALYDLYEELGTVRRVKEEADRLGLRSCARTAPDGTTTGGGTLDRGHIHHILTNPIYAARIRHRRPVYDGQHPWITDPGRWDAIQQRLQDGAARSRRKASAGRTSLLCRKLFDETGDRLTPSHSKTKTGTRLRYYISHKLVARSGEAHPGAWRLPAVELEQRIGDIVRKKLSQNGFVASLLRGDGADGIAQALATATAWIADAKPNDLLALVGRVDIGPGAMILKMDAAVLAVRCAIDGESINQDALESRHPFRLRKRGVETRLVMIDAPTGQDETLIRNIARALSWLERIKAGETFAQIAEAEGTSKRRVQQMIDLAFLAPDIIRDVLDGKQPTGFTSDWCKSHDLPSDWSEQRALIATL